MNLDWKPKDGGELKLFPFPYMPTEISPVAGRLVLFPSAMMIHSVLPSFSRRYAIVTLLLNHHK